MNVWQAWHVLIAIKLGRMAFCNGGRRSGERLIGMTYWFNIEEVS